MVGLHETAGGTAASTDRGRGLHQRVKSPRGLTALPVTILNTLAAALQTIVNSKPESKLPPRCLRRLALLPPTDLPSYGYRLVPHAGRRELQPTLLFLLPFPLDRYRSCCHPFVHRSRVVQVALSYHSLPFILDEPSYSGHAFAATYLQLESAEDF